MKNRAASAVVTVAALTVFTGGSMAQQPVAPPPAVEWRFDRAQPDWKATPQWHSAVGPATLARTAEGLRVTLDERTDTRKFIATGTLVAGIHVDVPGWNRGDWAEVVVRARADRTNSVTRMGLRFNLRERPESATNHQSPYQFAGEGTAVVGDGSIRTYRLRADWSQDSWLPDPNTPLTGPGGARPWQGPWRQLALHFNTDGKPGSIEILSVSVVPKGAVRLPKAVEWRFDRPQPDWKATPPNSAAGPATEAVQLERRRDALHVTLTESSRQSDKLLHGGIYVDLPGWRREEWARIIVRCRTTSVTTIGGMLILNDGSVHTYEIGPQLTYGGAAGPWLRLGLDFRASEPGSIDILSVSVVPIARFQGERQ
jgi:hypothetical protein